MHSTQDFIEKMGLLTERSGMPRIAGRMLAFLLLDGEAHTLDDLATQLQVSKASVSTNARLLEQRGFVTRVALPGDRRDFYRVVEAPWDEMMRVVSEHLRDMHCLLDKAGKVLPIEEARVRKRLFDWAEFHAFLLEEMNNKILQWRARHAS